jgi:superfamily I DNA and/or RNA helicase
MFKGMEAQSLGWLFIDEAGQAVPQAAIGAMWRAQKTVVVGDPLQIEPVVTLPKVVLQDIASYYDVNDHFISIGSSVQTVADLANRNGTYIQGKWIGSPLWVHRRCISPMFDICNEIAYEGRMVLDTSAPDIQTLEQIELLGSNAWIQVEGESTVKQYVPEQAKVVLRLIWKAFESQRMGVRGQLPSLYVISPFAAVKQQLKERLRGAHHQIAGSLSKKEFNKWINQSIGTVHTFQGKQADSVIFCLGVDVKKPGAADWATVSVNLINVAVSRAKYRFIVVGDTRVWAPKEFMGTVNRYMEEEVQKQAISN